MTTSSDTHSTSMPNERELVSNCELLTQPETWDDLLSRIRPEQIIVGRTMDTDPKQIKTKEEYLLARQGRGQIMLYPAA